MVMHGFEECGVGNEDYHLVAFFSGIIPWILGTLQLLGFFHFLLGNHVYERYLRSF